MRPSIILLIKVTTFAFIITQINGDYGGGKDESFIYHEQGMDGHGSYNFGYDIKDAHYGSIQSHKEKKVKGYVTGSYAVREPDGHMRYVQYEADHKKGFRATIKDKNGVKEYGYQKDGYGDSYSKGGYDDYEKVSYGGKDYQMGDYEKYEGGFSGNDYGKGGYEGYDYKKSSGGGDDNKDGYNYGSYKDSGYGKNEYKDVKSGYAKDMGGNGEDGYNDNNYGKSDYSKAKVGYDKKGGYSKIGYGKDIERYSKGGYGKGGYGGGYKKKGKKSYY